VSPTTTAAAAAAAAEAAERQYDTEFNNKN